MKAAERIANGDFIWREDAKAAHEEALQRIRATISAPATHLLDFSDLSALNKLPDAIGQCDQLQSLDCSDTQVSDLAPLRSLNQLQNLYCSHTQISDLAPLGGLKQLQRFHCSDTEIQNTQSLRELLSNENLVGLYTYRTLVYGLPDEILSAFPNENCAERLRAHFANLGDNP